MNLGEHTIATKKSQHLTVSPLNAFSLESLNGKLYEMFAFYFNSINNCVYIPAAFTFKADLGMA